MESSSNSLLGRGNLKRAELLITEAELIMHAIGQPFEKGQMKIRQNHKGDLDRVQGHEDRNLKPLIAGSEFKASVPFVRWRT